MGQRFIQPQDEIYEPLEQGSNDLGVPAHLIRLRRPAPERQLDQHSRRSWNEIIQIDFRRVREQKQRATTSSGTAYDPYSQELIRADPAFAFGCRRKTSISPGM